MNSDRELLEALLAGKVLIGKNEETIQLMEGNIKLIKCPNKGCEGSYLRGLNGNSLLELETGYWTIKPETILINGIEVPMPEKVTPEQDTEYYYPDLDDTEEPYYRGNWAADYSDTERFQKGLIHLTKENAIAHAKALLSFTTEEQ